MKKYLFIVLLIGFWGCNILQKKDIIALFDYEPINYDGSINALIEIPAGTLKKWEFNKVSGLIELEIINNKPRIIDYLGYPANYGMIPKTLLAKKNGGDGDPLDIIVIGPPQEKGSVVKCKIIGVLHLIDNLEKDDKLIAVLHNSTLNNIHGIKELDANYNGILEILDLWFTNYKGSDEIISKGFGDEQSASRILNSAINQYLNNQ